MAKECQIKRGMFSVRSCGARAKDQCKRCGKQYCQEHDSIPSTPRLCCVCQAKELRTRGKQGTPDASSVGDHGSAGRGQRSQGQSHSYGGSHDHHMGSGYYGVGYGALWYYGYRDSYYQRNDYRPHDVDGDVVNYGSADGVAELGRFDADDAAALSADADSADDMDGGGDVFDS